MRSSSFLRTAVLAAACVLLPGTGTQAGPMPTHVTIMKSMVDQNTTEVRWVGGWRGGYGYRGVGGGYRGGWGYRGYGYRGLGYGVAGAVVGGAIARSAYYGGYGDYYGGYYGGGYPVYSSPSVSYYGYGYGDSYCPPYDGY